MFRLMWFIFKSLTYCPLNAKFIRNCTTLWSPTMYKAAKCWKFLILHAIYLSIALANNSYCVHCLIRLKIIIHIIYEKCRDVFICRNMLFTELCWYRWRKKPWILACYSYTEQGSVLLKKIVKESRLFILN